MWHKRVTHKYKYNLYICKRLGMKMQKKSKKKAKNYTPSHGIRIDNKDYETVAKFLKKAGRTWNWLFKVLANQIRQRESLNIDLLLLEAKRKEDSRTVNLWKEDQNYKPIKETFGFDNNPEEVFK